LLRGAEGRGSPVEGPFLTVAEAAAVLRVSTATVYKLCARGELVHVRVLNVIRIPSEAMGMLRGNPGGAVP
jgi:excisionase family DNA binding protein